MTRHLGTPVSRLSRLHVILRALLWAGCWIPAGAQPLVAQTDGGLAALRSVATEVAGNWEVGRMAELSALLSSQGIRVDLGRGERSSVSPRQALAALRDFRGGYTTRSSTIARAAEVGGTPPRGFAELAWESVGPGGSDAVVQRIFFGFVLEEPGWRVSEIRLLR